MNVKRFTARSMRDALRQVREALGGDAVILEERRVGGLIEIAAATEMPGAEAEAGAFGAGGLSAGFRERLAAMGFDAAFIDTLMRPGGVPPRTWEEVKQSVGRQFLLAPRSVAPERGRLRFVGPTGVGKTTTLIKLAANHVLHYGNDRIALVTADFWRLAGSEQLALAGELLRIPVLEAGSPAELETMLESVQHKALVLLDLPGAGGELIDDALFHAGPGFETAIVVPAVYQRRVIESCLEEFAPLGFQFAAVTFVDRAPTIAEPLGVLSARQTPVAWLATGTGLPDDLEAASSEAVLALLERSIPRTEATA